MDIHVFTPGFKYQNSRALLTPLILWNKYLKKNKLNIFINSKITNNFSGDIALVDSKYHRNFWIDNEEKIYNDFDILKKNFNKLVYCDTADSSGWIQSEILPLVNSYWKFQILKDKKLYLKAFYDKRIFTDFYHTKYNISDNDKYYSSKISNKKDLDKVKVFWNSSMANYSKFSHINAFIYQKIRFNSLIDFNYKEIKDFSLKKNDIFCRFTDLKYRNTISFHRKMIKKELSYFKNLNYNKINRRKYFQEMKSSKVSISPFGWGEIAYRDFESFINKTILIKPDMSHLETWPNLYIENKTYKSIKWNFTNVIETIENVLDNYSQYKELANEGYYNYIKYTYSKEAPLFFEKRFISLIKDLI